MSRAEKITLTIRICLVLLTVAVSILVFGPFGGAEEKFGLTDKEAHTLCFYTLSVMGLLAMPRMRKLDVALICLAFGALIEVIQSFVGRDGDILDWLADGFGVMLAIAPMMFEQLRSAIRRDGKNTTPRRRRTDPKQPQPSRSPAGDDKSYRLGRMR
ncbi:MAG: VanZ family protein [Asticcacaulis sp.]